MLQALVQNDVPFDNADGLRAAAELTLQLLRKSTDAEVSLDELMAIRTLRTAEVPTVESNSARWFVCPNGYLVSFQALCLP